MRRWAVYVNREGIGYVWARDIFVAETEAVTRWPDHFSIASPAQVRIVGA